MLFSLFGTGKVSIFIPLINLYKPLQSIIIKMIMHMFQITDKDSHVK